MNISKLKYLPHVALATAVLMIAVLGWLLYDAKNKSQESVTWASHTLEVVKSIGKVNELLNQAEIAQRSYILSGLESFLSERDQALVQLGTQSKNLQKLTSTITRHPSNPHRLTRYSDSLYISDYRYSQ